MTDKEINRIVEKYVGIPFKDHGNTREGCDCYGLVYLIYKEEFGLLLPQVGDMYDNAYNRKEVDGLLTSHLDYHSWCIDVTKNPPYRPFDMLVFRIAGTDHHVGRYIRDGYMLHIIDGCNSGIERYTGIRWGRQLHRVIRHRDYDQE